MHADYILSLCSQRIFLMKRLRDHGLAVKYIHTVFQAISVRRILYALPAWGCFLSKELSGRIDAFLKRCYRYRFASEIEHVDVLFDRACVDLFHKIRCSEHCLWSPYGIGQTIIFSCCGLFFLLLLLLLLLSFFLSSPNLSRRRLDVCHTSTHGVALVRI